MCASSRAPFWQNRVFSLEVSQKSQTGVNSEREAFFFSRSHAAWESNLQKVALKALAEAYFFFGGEWVVFSRILVFLVLFGGRPSVFVVFVRVL